MRSSAKTSALSTNACVTGEKVSRTNRRKASYFCKASISTLVYGFTNYIYMVGRQRI